MWHLTYPPEPELLFFRGLGEMFKGGIADCWSSPIRANQSQSKPIRWIRINEGQFGPIGINGSQLRSIGANPVELMLIEGNQGQSVPIGANWVQSEPIWRWNRGQLLPIQSQYIWRPTLSILSSKSTVFLLYSMAMLSTMPTMPINFTLSSLLATSSYLNSSAYSPYLCFPYSSRRQIGVF